MLFLATTTKHKQSGMLAKGCNHCKHLSTFRLLFILFIFFVLTPYNLAIGRSNDKNQYQQRANSNSQQQRPSKQTDEPDRYKREVVNKHNLSPHKNSLYNSQRKKPFVISTTVIVFKKMLSLCGLDAYFATQFNTANDIPDQYFKDKREIKVLVVKVSDGDTYKVRHLASSQSRNYNGALKDHTIIVRIAAVDTPETAKQGNPGQKYANEAKEFAERKVLNQEATVKLLSKDQYGRVIGLVKYRERGISSWFGNGKDISEELLKQGFASVYRQGGAQYDGSVERWNKLEKAAQAQKKGIWENGVENADLPSTYKKAIKKKDAAHHDNRM